MSREGLTVTLPLPAAMRALPVVPMAVRPWIGAVMISFSAVWVRLADVEVARSAFLRTAYALPVLAILVAISGRKVFAHARERTDGPRWWLPVAFAAGVLLGLDFVAWHATIEIVGAGLGTVLPNLQVVFVGVTGVLLFRERPAMLFWIGLPIVLAGVWLLGAYGRTLASDGSMLLGIFWGVVTALMYAGALIVLRLARARTPSVAAVSVLWSLTLGAAIATLIPAAASGVAGPAGWPADGWLLLLAVGSQVVGWLVLTTSIHHLPAAATSVALLLQPVLALVWGALLLSEPLGGAQFAGAVTVLAGVALAHRGVVQAHLPDQPPALLDPVDALAPADPADRADRAAPDDPTHGAV